MVTKKFIVEVDVEDENNKSVVQILEQVGSTLVCVKDYVYYGLCPEPSIRKLIGDFFKNDVEL